MSVLRGSCLCLGLALAFIGEAESEALGAPNAVPEVSVRWSAPALCPTREAVESAVAEHLGRAVSRDPGREALVADARVEALGGGGYRLVLEITRGALGGKRVLEDADCAQLGAAAAFIVAVAADPSVLDRPADPAAGSDTASSAPGRNPALDPILVLRPRRRLHGAVRGTGGVEVGALPSPGGALHAAAALRGVGWGVEAGVAVLFPRETQADGTHPIGGPVHARGDLYLVAGTLDACYHLARRRRVEFPVCLGGELGALHVVRTSLTQLDPDAPPATVTAHERSVLWVALAASLGVTVKIRDHFGLALRAVSSVPVTQYELFWEGVDVAFSVGPASLRLLAGVEGRFGAG